MFYRKDPANGWLPDVREIERLITPATRALVVIDPNNPTGASYPDEIRRGLIEIADKHNIPLLADEVYGDLAYDGPVAPMASLYPDAPIISFSSLSKAYLAPGWRAGWMAVGRTDRLDDVLGGGEEAGGRPALLDRADGVRDPRGAERRPVARGDASAPRCASARTSPTARLNAIDGIRVVAPAAAFYAMPQVSLPPGVTDEDYVLGLLRATGVLCVYGSGFGTKPEDGFFRVVFLANPARAVGHLRPRRRLHPRLPVAPEPS